ncbi:putative cyclin-dependent kinase inhibitor [Helianthus annuus]|uniref:Cyclin-dependent kinase inhibitor n=1 Tax=Helianthus annuus TaxID=4232 RepID=A0A251SG59_HELAN|nr:cyclin-dependent kinase inhibitor 4 isoform X1 [Helianthus annuus]KAF5768302.1 putative cyclin-dependent kinase inhibitor [Helianthus annuus]KAJ0485072.1 putative cyclin-dependent kinase inhibitor domain-containing protein [Helianthus annuus]KAJ0655622.1 putative cyclin-dependent kinase inhibitor domain-containing protein [Helianthus annuus]KAJ0659309.1 putative cyclin-dependent kinase inhibitor domain-containing protein [Helianthus annuus]KAJ0852942.1 putative cyclin-dependent kinase inhib
MGKYINRNSKPTGELSLIDIPTHGGVRTRAKTLALQNATVSSTAGSYIQLRSRRLVKPTPPKRRRVKPKSNKSSYKGAGSYKGANLSGVRVRVRSASSSGSVKNLGDDEGSFGENVLEIEGKGRSTRETTPCNLIRDPDTITTPGSSTKRASYSNNANYRVQTSAPSHIPLTVEMDEFFTEPERQQQQLFIEKYNFDPVNDKPLPGRYEWVKMDGTKDID